LREKEPSLYGLESTENDTDQDSSAHVEGVLSEVTARLRQVADETYMSIRGWDDLYLTLTQIAQMGHVEIAVLLNHGFLEFCLRLLCMHVCKRFQEDALEIWRIVNKRAGIYNGLIGFISTLLSQTDTNIPVVHSRQGDDRLATLDRGRMRFPLTHNEMRMLFWWDNDLNALAVLDKALEMFDAARSDYFYPGDIVKAMLGHADMQAQSSLAKTMIDGIGLDPQYCDAYIRASVSFCEVSPVLDNVTKVINAVIKAITSTSRTEEDRLPGGAAVLEFFTGLLHAENEAVFQQKNPEFFQQYLMVKSRAYAIPLLMHPQEDVRRGAHSLLCELYKSSQESAPETLHMKWKTLRDMVEDLTHRIMYERDSSMLKSSLTPLISTGEFLVQELCHLNEGVDPDMEQYKDFNDAGRIQQWETEVEERLGSWPQGDDLPADLYDQSDFDGSESDVEEFLDTEA
jgi:ubiquitin carboxyl-terminal hydrolase 34